MAYRLVHELTVPFRRRNGSEGVLCWPMPAAFGFESAGSEGVRANRSDGHVVRDALSGDATAFVASLDGSDVTVAEEFLNLADVDAGAQQQGRCGRT